MVDPRDYLPKQYALLRFCHHDQKLNYLRNWPQHIISPRSAYVAGSVEEVEVINAMLFSTGIKARVKHLHDSLYDMHVLVPKEYVTLKLQAIINLFRMGKGSVGCRQRLLLEIKKDLLVNFSKNGSLELGELEPLEELFDQFIEEHSWWGLERLTTLYREI